MNSHMRSGMSSHRSFTRRPTGDQAWVLAGVQQEFKHEFQQEFKREFQHEFQYEFPQEFKQEFEARVRTWFPTKVQA